MSVYRSNECFAFKICPICGHGFIPAPQHVYTNACNKKELVCTYNCRVKSIQMADEKEFHKKKRTFRVKCINFN